MPTSTAEVWTEFSGRLRAFVGARVGGEGDVDDILQTVFAKIHVQLGRLRRAERLESWLFQIARRATTDHFRERRAAAWPGDVEEKAPAAAATAEVAAWLRPMMEALPEVDREALRLELEGLSQKDVAERLGLSLTGAKSRIQRARRKLKEVLLDCCHVEMDRRGNALGYTPNHRARPFEPQPVLWAKGDRHEQG